MDHKAHMSEDFWEDKRWDWELLPKAHSSAVPPTTHPTPAPFPQQVTPQGVSKPQDSPSTRACVRL